MSVTALTTEQLIAEVSRCSFAPICPELAKRTQALLSQNSQGPQMHVQGPLCAHCNRPESAHHAFVPVEEP